MIRTQVQLPDDIYRNAKRLAEAREVSLAELMRRGLEYILSVYAPPEAEPAAWTPPSPRHLGSRGLTDAELKAEARRTTAEQAAGRRVITGGRAPEGGGITPPPM